MKRKKLLWIVLSLLMAMTCAVGTTAFAADEIDPETVFFSENFDAYADGTTPGGVEGMQVADQALKSQAVYSKFDLPLSGVTIPENYTLTFDAMYTEDVLTGDTHSSFVCVNIFDGMPGKTIETTAELMTDGRSELLYKINNAIPDGGATFDMDRHPKFVQGERFNFKIEKFGESIFFSINNVQLLSYEFEEMGTPSGLQIYTFSMYSVIFDNILAYETVPMASETRVYYENFNSMEAGATFGGESPFVVSEDKQLSANAVFNAADLPIDSEAVMPAEWTMAYDVTFPDTVTAGYVGMNFSGIDTHVYELTIQKLDANNGETLIKYNNADVAKSSGEYGVQVPKMYHGRANFVKMMKTKDDILIYVNGDLTISYPVSARTAPTMINLYQFQSEGCSIDNIEFSKYDTDIALTGVRLIANRHTFSDRKVVDVSTKIIPSIASYSSISWKLDGVETNVTTRTYRIQGLAAGTHTLQCIIDEVESEALTVTVTASTQEEKDAYYFEQFEGFTDGATVGSFVARDEAVTTSGNYNRMDFAQYAKNFSFALDITFNTDSAAGTYFGLNVTGLESSNREMEFNLRRGVRIGEEIPEEDALDLAIIKETHAGQDPVETTFNNSEKYGRMPELTFETGVTYRYTIIRWENQLEMWLDDELLIKTIYSAPTEPTRMFLYYFNGEGTDLTIDNIVYKASEKPSEILTIPVTSARVTSNIQEPEIGEEVTLTVDLVPYDATPESFQWYLNDQKIEGATSNRYKFTPDKAGKYTFHCVVDDVKSASKVFEITEEVDPACGCGTVAGMSMGGGIGLFALVACIGAVLFVILRKRSRQAA